MINNKENNNKNNEMEPNGKNCRIDISLPAVLVTCKDEDGTNNIITVAWTGTVCTITMTYISLRPSRYSYGIIEKTKEFVINITTEKLVRAVDFCGVIRKDYDKFKDMNDTTKWKRSQAPLIKESPVNIECRLRA